MKLKHSLSYLYEIWYMRLTSQDICSKLFVFDKDPECILMAICINHYQSVLIIRSTT